VAVTSQGRTIDNHNHENSRAAIYETFGIIGDYRLLTAPDDPRLYPKSGLYDYF